MIRVLVVGNEEIFIRALEQEINKQSDMEIIATVRNGIEVSEKIKKFKPDVIVLETIMPRLDDIGVLEKLEEGQGKPIIVMFSTYGADDSISNYKASIINKIRYWYNNQNI